MELWRTAFAFVVCLFVPAHGQPQCSCFHGCGNDGTTFPGSEGNIVNVAFEKSANMSTVFPEDGESGPACAAVNGRTDTEWIPKTGTNTNCVHTALRNYDAFWFVDLGRYYTVTNITVYRREGESGAIRMSGMSVYVDDQLCYSFLNRTSANMAELRALDEQINITCPTPLTGRRVRFQKHGEDREYDPGAYLINLCEVQVWACKDGLYGAQCDQTCSGHCKDNVPCDNYNGTCPTGCSTGYRGDPCNCGHCRDGAGCGVTTLACPHGCDKGWGTPFCNQSCQTGTHGYDCGQQCGQCAGSDTCNTVTGLCPNGCQPGWQGDNCTQECDDGKYGNNCSSRCGHCNTGDVCHHINGTCPGGCAAGFDPSDPLCETSCTEGKYGAGCLMDCGNCRDDAACNATSGVCPDGCDPGWTKPSCTQECPSGSFGDNCSMKCSNCSEDRCNNTDGECLAGCKPGYQWTPQNQFCNEFCQNDRFGKNCSEPCGHCNGTVQCDPFTGTCAACQPQFQLPLCKVCTGNRYGARCELSCSTNCDGDGSCYKDSGKCVGGCEAGYRPGEKGFCNETCEVGKYGKECSENCGNCNGACRHDDGYCLAGCMDGFEGVLCASKVYSSGPDNTPLIGGVAGGVVVLIALCAVVAFFIIRRRKNNPKARSAHTNSSSETANGTRETALSFDPVADSEAPKSSKPSAAVKPMVAKKPSKGDNQEDSSHIYYNTADIAAHQQSTPAPQAAPASAPTQGQTPASGPPPRPQSPVSTRQVADPADYDEGTEGDNVYYNDEEDVYASFKATQPKLDAVQKYLVDAVASGKLKEEFATLESMPEGVPQEVALLKKNFKKNRFAAILPYDRNLVVLRDGYSVGTATDFVNASYVSGYQLDKQFIAAQGPRDNTVGDLWRMIWQEQITHVVMLTNIQEKGKPKCELYWPEEEGGVDTFGPVTVTTAHVQCRDDFFIRTFNVQRAGSAEAREVTQYHYVSWPDHGAPTTTSLVTFWRYVHNRTKPADGASVPPVLVHCSAGVGRTGTYIGLEIGVDMAVNEGHINVLDLVKRLREERCLMVQAVDQYLFLHKALLEAYTANGTNVSVDEFDVIFTGHITSDKPHPRVDKEFQTLQQMLTLSPAHRHDSAILEDNMAKNRNPNILPSDEHLVYLTEHVSGRNQYINAVFMPTFRDHRGSIVTQLPLPSTLVDFWRLVYGNDVSAIVSLSAPNEEQEVKPYCQYWPTDEGESVKAGPYFVALNSKTERRGSKVTSYTLSLGKKGVKTARVVELLQYKGWTGKVGGSTSDILHLIDTLVTLQNTNTDRLVVQCSDGVGKSGLFCALCDIINRMTYDREVDVYMTVRHVQSVTPKALSSVTQYRYCYEVVQNRVREMSVYANAPQR